MTEHHIRRVPTALLIAVVVQTVGGLVWAGGAAARIATLEQRVGEQRLVAERLARLEAAQPQQVNPSAAQTGAAACRAALAAARANRPGQLAPA